VKYSYNTRKGWLFITYPGTQPPLPPESYDGLTWDKTVVPGTLVHGDKKMPNPWSYVCDENSYASGSVITSPYQGGSIVYAGKFPADGGSTIPHPRAASRDPTNLALDRLNEKVRGNLDLSVAVAEAGQTAKMLRVTSTAVHAASQLWGRKLNAVKKASEFAAARWLELQYGWKPLMSDLYGALDENLRTAMNKLETIHAGGSIRFGAETRDFSGYGGAYKGVVNYEGLRGVKFQICMEPGYDQGLDRWTSLNPLGIAYELMPYSFVVDWFYDIGGYMRNMETALLYQNKFVSGFRTDLLAYNASAIVKATAVSGGVRSVSNLTFWRKYVSFDRTVLGSYPLPRFPQLSADLGASRLLSAAALLQQFVKGENPQIPKDFSLSKKDLSRRFPMANWKF